MPSPTSHERGAGVNLVLSAAVLVAAMAVVAWRRAPVAQFFFARAELNALIVAVFVIGAIYAFYRMIQIQLEFSILDSVREHFTVIGGAGRMSAETIEGLPPSFVRERLLLYNEQARRGHPLDASGHYERVAQALGARSEVTRYVATLLVFLGLAGTFFGLLTSISGVSDLVSGMNADNAGNGVEFLDKMRANLAEPLRGMATAYSASLFGLVGSLLVGFMHLQLGAAQSRYAAWLEHLDTALFQPAFAGTVRMFAPAAGGAGAPAGAGAPMGPGISEEMARYMEASQRQLKENLDRMVTIIEHAEDMQSTFREILSTIHGEIETTNAAITRLSANQDLIREAMGKMVDLSRAGDESNRLTLSELKNINEALARFGAAQHAAQKSNDELLKDLLRALRHETGALQKAMTP